MHECQICRSKPVQLTLCGEVFLDLESWSNNNPTTFRFTSLTSASCKNTFSFLITLLFSPPLIRSGSSNRKQGNLGIKEDYSQEFNKLICLPVCCPCYMKWLLTIEENSRKTKKHYFRPTTSKRWKKKRFKCLIFTISQQQHIQFYIPSSGDHLGPIQKVCTCPICFFPSVPLWPSSLLTHFPLHSCDVQGQVTSTFLSHSFPNLYRQKLRSHSAFSLSDH